MWNPASHSWAAEEIMKIIFTSDEQGRLRALIEELKNEEASLMNSAELTVKEMINRFKDESIKEFRLAMRVGNEKHFDLRDLTRFAQQFKPGPTQLEIVKKLVEMTK